MHKSHLQSVHHSGFAQSQTHLLAEQQIHPFVVDVVVAQNIVVVAVQHTLQYPTIQSVLPVNLTTCVPPEKL